MIVDSDQQCSRTFEMDISNKRKVLIWSEEGENYIEKWNNFLYTDSHKKLGEILQLLLEKMEGESNMAKQEMEQLETVQVAMRELKITEEKKLKYQRCESCMRKSCKNTMAEYVCFLCGIYICVKCQLHHKSHDIMKVESWKMVKVSEGFAHLSKRRRIEDEEGTQERRKAEKSDIRKMAERLWEDVRNESKIERRENLKCSKEIVSDRVKVKHDDFDSMNCEITGICGLSNNQWVVCDMQNSCIKSFTRGGIMSRYVRFESQPCGITEIQVKQNPTVSLSRHRSSVTCSSETYRTELGKQCLLAVSFPWKRQIIYLDLDKKPVIKHNVIKTEEFCYSLQFYDGKIFTVCRKIRIWSCCVSIYVKSTDWDTLIIINTDTKFGMNYGPCLAVASEGVYLTDYTNHKVQFINVCGTITAETNLTHPVGIAMDRDNKLYVCARSLGKICRLDFNLTRSKFVICKLTDDIGSPEMLFYCRDRLLITHSRPEEFTNFVSVFRLL